MWLSPLIPDHMLETELSLSFAVSMMSSPIWTVPRMIALFTSSKPAVMELPTIFVAPDRAIDDHVTMDAELHRGCAVDEVLHAGHPVSAIGVAVVHDVTRCPIHPSDAVNR